MPYQVLEENLKEKSAALLKHSPYGKVPCLVDDSGNVLYESAVIGEYLEESYPQAPLMPKGPFAKAQARLWEDYVTNHIAPPLGKIRRAETAAAAAAHLPLLKEKLGRMEEHLAGQKAPWLAGESFSLADINAIPFLARVAALEGEPLKDFPAITAWWNAVRERKSYQATL